MALVSGFLLPWEHLVCSECLDDNPYAIWLVKARCFQPHRHRELTLTLVVVDHQQMALVVIRPLPEHYNTFRGNFVNCQGYPDCPSGDNCGFAHLRCELENWSIKKRLLKSHPELLQGPAMSRAIHILSDVCRQCFYGHPEQSSLAWLRCVDPEGHGEATSSVVASLERRRLVPVRREVPAGGRYYREEEEYQQWQQAMAVAKQDPEYATLSDRYGYPEERSRCVLEDISRRLSKESYQSKFHKLLYLEELASSRKMIRECDSAEVTVQSAPFPSEDDAPTATFPVYLTGLTSSAMDYASHHEALVEIKLFSTNQIFSAPVEKRPDYDRNALVLRMHYRSIFFSVTGIKQGLRASVHFKNSPHYFHDLHNSISTLDDIALDKLMPEACFSSGPLSKLSISKFKLDPKYQLQALKKMLSCNPLAPYLLLGPFGTGKSFTLAAIVSYLLEGPGNRVLVCTHLNRGADGLYQLLQKRIGYTKTARNVVRLTKARGKLVNRGTNLTLNELLILDVEWPVIICTFSMASRLWQQQEGEFGFTHILVDEGAQCPEPEAIGALVWADKKTHVMIVGDNQQVGPKVSIVSNVARENGLGDSLLERLYNHYKTQPKATRTHTSTLLTNYRCHPSILTLASSLFYECTLLSYSSSVAHPRTPYPLVFACTSLDQAGFASRPPSCEKEAELLIGKMFELIKNWHIQAPQPRPVFGLLGSNKQQVACLRRVYGRMKKNHTVYGNVEIMPTYNIQGEEFDAVFLSTSEPTDPDGHPSDPVKSICNRYVFNTVITRAKSLVFVAGNPFLLHHMCSSFTPNCWAEFIRRCIQCQSLQLPTTGQDFNTLPGLVKKLRELVLKENINEITSKELTEEDPDTIIERYIADLSDRREFKLAAQLVQDPTGNMEWVQEDDSAGARKTKGVVWCQIDCKHYNSAKAIPTQPGQEAIDLSSLSSRRLAFHGDKVLVDTIKKCVLLDEEMERAIVKTHFGTTFLCRVDPQSPTRFFPMDKRHPKFVNLPMISCRTREHTGVVCFHPSSINGVPKPDNFIPLECAIRMLFIVKFLGWNRKFPFPLGIIVGALPFSGHCPEEGELILRVSNGIPLFPCQASIPVVPSSQNHPPRAFRDAFTIDPKGATDHDDALTVRRILQSADRKDEVFEVGIHITNVQKHIPQGSDLDKEACERGCSAYRSSDSCISRMLPDQLITRLSINAGSECDTLSVVLHLSAREGKIHEISKIDFVESRVSSSLELTYKEAQAVICNALEMPLDQQLERKLNAYDRQSSTSSLRIREQLTIAWRVAVCLRKGRLGRAANCLQIDDADTLLCPEAHCLIEEMMITANQLVAKKLLQHFPSATIVRTQGKPSDEAMAMLVQQNGKLMATSLTMQSYLPPGSTVAPDHVNILQTTFNTMSSNLAEGRVREALHYVQFESQHPHSAVAVANLRDIRGPTAYTITTEGESDYWHDTLRCTAYTHFTSPIRRYVDIIAQRLLVAAINRQPCPYGSRQELEAVCVALTNAVKKSNAYDRDVSNMDLAFELWQRSEEYIAFVLRVEEDAKIHFIFPDPKAKVLQRRQKTVHMRYLNASRIEHPSSRESTPPPRELHPAVAAPLRRSPANRGRRSPTPVPSTDADCTWVVKLASFQSTARSFLANPSLELCSTPTGAYAEVSFFIADSGREIAKGTNLKEKKLQFAIRPLTCTLRYSAWNEALTSVTKEPNDVDPRALLSALQPVQSLAAPASSPEVELLRRQPSALWVYTVHRPIKPCEAVKLQLSANSKELMLEPCIQLLEVAPEVQICIQHNANPSECFVTRLTENASKEFYSDLDEYFYQWEKVLIAEGAVTSLADCELLLVKDVLMKWPRLEKVIDSSGVAYYKLPAISKPSHGVEVKVPSSFLQSSYAFIRFELGDLVCVRYSMLDERGARLSTVFHMVIHHADKVISEQTVTKLTLYLKFVGDASNIISLKMGAVLGGSSTHPCELQLIPLTLPLRRIYRSLSMLQRREGSSQLADVIALGHANTMQRNCPDLKELLSSEQASIATSLWPLRQRTNGNGSGRMKLNKYQKKAINLAYSNNFTLIQGPPGTGKSVTGAHLAYALAMKLRNERGSGQTGSGRGRPGSGRAMDELRPCVMYCGPSQQSVNVVLEMLIAHNSPVKDKLQIVRVFSKTIEKKKYPGPERHDALFRITSTDSKCSPQHEPYALHCLIRQRHPEIASLDSQFDQLHRQAKVPSWSLREQYIKMIHKAEVEVLKSGVDILLCTCNEASSHRVMRSLVPQCCIVDECAMATEPECMVPIRRAEHVVLIGDHQQLGPVIQNRNASEMGLNCSLFKRYVEAIKPLMLQIQYRMHPAICEFPSKEFYGKLLETDSSVRKRQDPEAHLRQFWPQGKNKPFVFCHVDGREGETHTGQKERAKVGLESKFNTDEAKKIAYIAHVLHTKHGVPVAKLAALTPYSAQREELRKQLNRRALPGVTVKTITESQGSEFGIVLLSMVRSKETVGDNLKADIGWKRAHLGFIMEKTQICVAITRCKFGLVIVGNKKLLRYCDTWGRLIEHYQRNGCVVDGGSFP